jgi:2-methoxy-6-polyprenyl-1,4-benzoquinol methylase
VLDVAGGTGDIAFRIIDSINRGLWKPSQRPKVIISDINEHMLAVGKERAQEKGYLNECMLPSLALVN